MSCARLQRAEVGTIPPTVVCFCREGRQLNGHVAQIVRSDELEIIPVPAIDDRSVNSEFLRSTGSAVIGTTHRSDEHRKTRTCLSNVRTPWPLANICPSYPPVSFCRSLSRHVRPTLCLAYLFIYGFTGTCLDIVNYVPSKCVIR